MPKVKSTLRGDKAGACGYSANVVTLRSRVAGALLLAVAASLSSGCVSHLHTVGLGPIGAETVHARQYWWLGCIPVNEVDTQRMASGLTSYSIETKFGLADFLLAPLLLPLLSTSRTVVVRT